MMAQREFLGWDRPFLGVLVDWLWARRAELPGMCVVVPTAQSGRALRQALAERAMINAPYSECLTKIFWLIFNTFISRDIKKTADTD